MNVVYHQSYGLSMMYTIRVVAYEWYIPSELWLMNDVYHQSCGL